MNKKLQFKTFLIIAFCSLLSVQLNAQTDEDFSGGLNSWTNGWGGANSGTVSEAAGEGLFGDGALRLVRGGTGNNSNFGLNPAGIITGTVKVIKLRFKNDTDAASLRLQGGVANRVFSITPSSTEWITYYLDYTDGASHPTWTGTVDNLDILVRQNYDNTENEFLLDDVQYLTAMPTVDVTDPVLTSGTTATAIDENSGAGQVIYTVTATDNVAVLYYDISGTDAADFTINKATGAVTLTADPNFEVKEDYSFNVTAYDENTTNDVARNSATQTVTLAINDISESGDTTNPVITSLATATAIAENSGASQAVYTITATDDTAVTSYGLEAGDDAASFSIAGSTITLTADPDFETKSSYTFTVSASDAAANKGTLTVTLAITDVAESFSYTFDSTNEGFVSNGNRGSAFGSENVWNAGSGANTGLLVINGLETVDGTSGVSGANNVNAYGPSPVNTGNASHVTVVLRNKTLATGLKMRTKVNGGSYANVAVFTITANDTDFKTYTFDLSGYANWTGVDTEFSFAAFDSAFDTSTPFDAANINIAFDSIEFTSEAPATVDGTWESGATWSNGQIPDNGAPKTISGNVTINSNVVSSGPISLTAGSLTVKAGNSLTLTGDLVTNNSVVLEAGAQMIVNGASTGTASFTRTLPALTSDGADAGLEGWFSMTAPFSGASLNTTWADAGTNNIATSSDTNKRGIAWYTESSDAFTYLLADDSNATTFESGKGYVIKQSTAGDISFTGTINSSVDGVDVSVTNSGNGFNLLGNPYSALVNSGTFLTDTDNSGLFVSSEIWVWNDDGNSYNSQPSGNNFMLAPGQAFFVQVNAPGTLNFEQTNQSIGSDTFQKSSRSELSLIVKNGKTHRYANIYYLDNATLGYDNGYEGKVFEGIPNNFSVYTHLLENNESKKYQIQSLPSSNIESMVIPVGIDVAESSEITFTLEAKNIPSGLKVFLEDRQENTFTQLDVLNSEYKVSLTEASNGIGRFYLHTSASALSIDDVFLNSVSIFKSDASTLKVAGLKNGKASVSIFNILGKQVLNTSFTANGVKEIALPNVAKGVYLVQLTTESGKLNKKIILE